MSKQFYKNGVSLFMLWLSLAYVCKVEGQTLNMNKSVSNVTTNGDGTTASYTDVLQYTIIINNLSGANVTNARLFDNIPAGVKYLVGTTTLNGTPVADVSGVMPYAVTGSFINSPMYGAGVLAPHAAATITFRVTVTANGGNVSNYATLQAVYSSHNFLQNTNTVFTNLTPDASCSVIYQVTAITPPGSPADPLYYRFIKTLDRSNGQGGPILYDGGNDPCYDAISGAALAAGSLMDYVAAIAYDKTSNRIYFVNNYATNPAQDLCYVDLNASPVCARRFTGYSLEPNVSYNINRMAFASDGFGYAVTSRGDDLIRFTINPGTGRPVITQLGPLINDAINGANDVLSETGGDLFGDGSGKLYLIANSSKLYKINPANRITTYMGSINPSPISSSNSIAIDAAGNLFIGGSYQNAYRVNLASMAGVSITGGSATNVWTNGDFTSCGFPVLSPALIASKTYLNTRGTPFVVGGDTVEYIIDVTNTGNINAAGVKLYDSVPGATQYVPNSTTLNGVVVPDVGGEMPFSLVGGRFINSVGELNGIIKPGAGNKAVVKFKVKVPPNEYVCNQSRVTLVDGDGNTIFINSDDPATPGTQNSTCFLTDGVLPLTDLKIKGSIENNRSVLQWSMKEDEKVTWYDLEYAEDAKNFKLAAKVMARQDKDVASLYEFVDKTNTQAADRYYRLKLVQPGGRYTYSAVIFLSTKASSAYAYPNPFNKTINVQLPLQATEMVRFRLLDFSGREVLNTSEKLASGNHAVSLPVPANCTRGMYVLEVSTATGRIMQQKLLKR